MESIDSLGHPLAFKTRLDEPPDGAADRVAVRTEVRALEGMQKEALVHYGPTGTVWRMACDEGPYLQGTDLAPFPLAFYTAGVVFSYMEELRRAAGERDVELTELGIVSDHYYTMKGSALRGDMVGGARSVEMKVRLAADAPRETLEAIVHTAREASPAEACMRDSLANTFSLSLNGRSVPVADLHPSAGGADDTPHFPPPGDPAALFDGVEPREAEAWLDGIITKLGAAEVKHGVEGGAGSSLKAEQKRLLHVRGEAKLLDGALKELRVNLIMPIGSNFRFLSDEAETGGGRDLAPPALAYLAAGVGFCYMTQIGRYAHITKKALESYGIVQENVFHTAADGKPAVAEPVDTHVVLTLDDSEEVAQKVAYMGERTCFLHAALRTSNPTRVEIGP